MSIEGSLSEKEFPKEYTSKCQTFIEQLETWIGLDLDAALRVSAKHRLVDAFKKNDLDKIPKKVHHLRYVGEPSSQCGLGSAVCFVSLGSVVFIAGLAWGAISVGSVFSNVFPAFLSSISYDALDPAISSVCVVLIVVTLIALALGARHVDNHKKATHFYKHLTLFFEQDPGHLILAEKYANYLAEENKKMVAGGAKQVTIA